jgi:hypothetical protein
MSVNCPYDPPPLQIGTKGDKVLAAKIVTSRAGFWKWGEFDDVYYKAFADGKGRAKNTSGVRGLQRWLGIGADGVWGPATHNATLGKTIPKGLPHSGDPLWDAHAIALYKGGSDEPVLSNRESLVKAIYGWWDWMVARTAQIGYSQNRPMRELANKHKPPNLPFLEDCSATFIYCAFLAGAKSPDNTCGFTGYGYTGTLIKSGIWISENDLEKYQRTYYIGALYGPSVYNTTHISAVKSASQVYSMGNDRAPEMWRTYRPSWMNFLQLRAYPVN